MKIRIDRLTLEQFKGIGYASYSFGGRDAVLFGRNGTGKSSVCDAWCWLMTGKDSQGRVPADSGGFAIVYLGGLMGNIAFWATMALNWRAPTAELLPKSRKFWIGWVLKWFPPT